MVHYVGRQKAAGSTICCSFEEFGADDDDTEGNLGSVHVICTDQEEMIK